ncbi:MAG: hypothetical protein NUW24_17220 [Anaerolineae bacterium]|jgi:hypothetical protein|nr:hypothetical protein [Anaerolineae bacterium]MDH7474205.1 hypothetical protein [Anaerolineae bacterium]
MRKLDIVLIVLVVVSLILNGVLLTGSGLLLQRALKLRRAAVEMLDQATIGLASLEKERVEYPVHIQQNVPVVADVPFRQTMVVPLRTTVPISFTAVVPVNLMLTTVEMEIPIDLAVPLDLEVPVTISQTVHISTTVPLNMNVPVTIDVAETPLRGYLAQFRKTLERLRESL